MCIEGRKKSFRKKVVCSVVFFFFFLPFLHCAHAVVVVESFPSFRSPNIYFCCCFPLHRAFSCCCWWSGVQKFFLIFVEGKSSPDSLCIFFKFKLSLFHVLQFSLFRFSQNVSYRLVATLRRLGCNSLAFFRFKSFSRETVHRIY